MTLSFLAVLLFVDAGIVYDNELALSAGAASLLSSSFAGLPMTEDLVALGGLVGAEEPAFAACIAFMTDPVLASPPLDAGLFWLSYW